MSAAAVRMAQGTAGSTPAAGKSDIYIDSADRRAKMLGDDGVKHQLSTYIGQHNLLINGGFDLAQRQAPGTLTTYNHATTRQYGADRWGMINENASIQYQRADAMASPETGLVSRYYGTFKKITSAGKVVVSQVLEGRDTAPLRGKNVRLQLKLKASTATTMRVGLLQLTSAGTVDTMPASFASAFGAVGTDPTWGTNLSAIAPSIAGGQASISGAGLTCNATTAWQAFSGVFTVPAGCQNIIVVVFTNGQPAANDTFSIAEVGLYDGEEILDWSPLPVQKEIARAQRYCAKSFNLDTAPAQNVGATTGESRWQVAPAGTTANRSPSIHFPVLMRAAPTITLYNPAAANAHVRDFTAVGDMSASAAAGTTERQFYITATGNIGGAVGGHCGIHWLAEAEL